MESQEADRDSRSSGGDATDTIADRKVDDDRTAGAEAPCRVRSVRRNNCRTAGARDVLYAIDRDRQLPLDYVPHLLLRMVVLGDRGGVKGAAATVAHMVVERGLFGYDTPIVQLWPEFGAHGRHRRDGEARPQSYGRGARDPAGYHPRGSV